MIATQTDSSVKNKYDDLTKELKRRYEIKIKESDPISEIVESMDNLWAGYLMKFDGIYAHDISDANLKELSLVLPILESNVSRVRAEIERRLNKVTVGG